MRGRRDTCKRHDAWHDDTHTLTLAHPLVEQGTHVDGRGGSVGGRIMHDDDLQAVVQRDGAVSTFVIR